MDIARLTAIHCSTVQCTVGLLTLHFSRGTSPSPSPSPSPSCTSSLPPRPPRCPPQTSSSARPLVKKKASLCLLRLFRKNPDIINLDTW